ncbi:MAG: DUF169 domain-containing protein [Chlorobi bacterium]|nr:DUF169 domain-containing protein [Chlorobiota bacterium]
MEQPNYKYLMEKTGIRFPLIGFYDTDNKSAFEPLILSRTCVFAYYKQWEKGKSLLITGNQFGCPGAGTWLCNIKSRTKEDYIKFLADDEGLKASRDLMGQWLDHVRPYKQQYENLIIGPLKASEYKYLKTITFFVNPDQLSILMIGAQLFSKPCDPEPVLAPFGSGCMQLVSLFDDLDIPQAIIGATDMAMRKYIPFNILALTVTKPMFEQLCSLGRDSYLNKKFINELKKARKNDNENRNILSGNNHETQQC